MTVWKKSLSDELENDELWSAATPPSEDQKLHVGINDHLNNERKVKKGTDFSVN